MTASGAHDAAMRGVITIAGILALCGCNEAPHRATAEESRRLSKNIVLAMCSDDQGQKAMALSRIVEITNGDSDYPEQGVYDEASDIADKGCPSAP